MKNKEIKHKHCIKKRTKQIKSLLKTDLAYEVIVRQIQQQKKLSVTIHFLRSKYSKGKLYYFTYTAESAKYILDSCQHYTNSFDLILRCYCEDDLNLHSYISGLQNYSVEPENEEFDSSFLENSNFTKSNLTQENYFKTLEVSNWSYQHFVVSALYFHLETVYHTYLKRCETARDKAFHEFALFNNETGLHLLNNIYGEELFIALQSTNIFIVYADCALRGLASVLYFTGFDYISSYETKNRLDFFQYINNTDEELTPNFRYILFYLKFFENFIPLSVIDLVRKYCYLTKSVHVLYYILKKYENILNTTLNEQKKKYSDYVFSTHLENELNNI